MMDQPRAADIPAAAGAVLVLLMRFCFLTTFYPPYNFGGDGIDVQRTARALVGRGHEVTVIHDIATYEWLSGRHPTSPPATDGVKVVGLRSSLGVIAPLLTHQLGRPLIHGRQIARIMAEGQFDVVVFNNVSLVGGPGLLSYGGRALKVYMAHEHWLVCPTHVLWRFNHEPCDKRACTRCVLSYKRPPQIWRYTGMLERQIEHVDLFIARSEFSRRKHQEFGFSRPMEVLPYFLPDESSAAPVPVSARPHARPYFLFVGRLTNIKGVDSIVPAFARYPDADLLVIGDGEELAHLEALAGGAPNVKFLGRIPNDELAPYYQHAIASVVPSAGYETFGIVLIESFRYKTPVIARRIGPFPEIVEQARGGLLFSNEDELVAAAARLQQNPAERSAFGENGYQGYRSYWSERVVVTRFLDLVDGVRARTPALARAATVTT
jgi:glycosyltransferase involved in cell wall biosynthesis